MRLTGTTHTIELVTSAAGDIGWHGVFNNVSASDSTALDGQGNITAAATTTLVAAPAASEQRQVVNLFIANNGTAANAITIQKNAAATQTPLFKATLAPGESIQFSPNVGFRVNDAQGRQKNVNADAPPVDARIAPFIKNTGATAAEAAGIRYWPGKDGGFPAAWVPGTPGLAGRVVDGMVAADSGCYRLWTPAGSLWLRRFNWVSSQLCSAELADLLFVNSGIAVTTTTAQTLNTVALPARDANGSSDGLNVQAALLVTTATTNAGAITNCTINYTNEAGVAGRTGVMGSFPATCVIGSVIPFDLATGDSGVRSVESITLGTSLVTGAVSLVMYRILDMSMSAAAWVNNPQSLLGNSYIRLWSGAALFPLIVPTTTTQQTVVSSIVVEER